MSQRSHAVVERDSTPRARSAQTRVWPARLLGAALAALLVLPLAEATHPAVAGKKFKTITKSASSVGQIDIVDDSPADPYPSTISVDDFAKFKKAKITDVNLTLRGLTHTHTENIDVMLVHGNRHAIVMADPGDSVDVDNLTITLDDEAGADLPDGAVLTSGTFRPGNQTGSDVFPAPAPAPNANIALSTFDDAKPDGDWQLFINDDANLWDGFLSNGWKLEITAKVKNEKKDKHHKKGNHSHKQDE